MVKRLLIWAGLFGLMGASSVWAQDKAKEAEERYYLGIGLSFFEFHKDVPGTDRHDNSSGLFNSMTAVSRVLKGGPADQAGVQEGWFVAEINGQDVLKLGADVIVDLIKKDGQPGKSVKIKFREYQKNQQNFREIELIIPLEKVDSVAWLPFDRYLAGSMGWSSDFEIGFASKISEIKLGTFLYSYRLTNTSKTEEVFVSWEILEIASHGTWALPVIIRLKPSEVKEFTFTSDGLPSHEMGLARVFYSVDDDFMDQIERAYGFKAAKDGFLISMGSSMPGFIPRKLFEEVQINKLREQ